MLTDLQKIGIVIFVIGIIIRYTINRRRFYRRGVGGLEHFKSYGRSVFIRFVERLFRFLAMAMILLGAFLFLTAYLDKI
jgi:hypothetical protein